jgi:hypothetical protein
MGKNIPIVGIIWGEDFCLGGIQIAFFVLK